MPLLFLSDRGRGVDATFGFTITNIPNGEWLITVRSQSLTVERRAIDGAAVRKTAVTPTFVLVSVGRLSPIRAMLTGRLKVQGNPLLSMKFGQLLMMA